MTQSQYMRLKPGDWITGGDVILEVTSSLNYSTGAIGVADVILNADRTDYLLKNVDTPVKYENVKDYIIKKGL